MKVYWQVFKNSEPVEGERYRRMYEAHNAALRLVKEWREAGNMQCGHPFSIDKVDNRNEARRDNS